MPNVTFLPGTASVDKGSLTADPNGDILGTAYSYSVGGSVETVFEIPYVGGSYASRTVLFALPANPTFLDLASSIYRDSSGNLFDVSVTNVANTSAISATIYEDALTNGAYAGTPTVLAAIPDDGAAESAVANLVADSAGDLFGTLNQAGSSTNSSQAIVFELPATANGVAGTPITLASFGLGANIETPYPAPTLGGLLADASGNLFGISEVGGANGQGEVYEIARTANGYVGITSVLASFGLVGSAVPGFLDPLADDSPPSALTMDAAGDLFGETDSTVFEIAKTADGYADTATPIAPGGIAFGYDGGFLNGRLAIDAAGDLFGETSSGEITYDSLAVPGSSDGTVFEIPRTATGYASTATTLAAGFNPGGGLVVGASGALFGTAQGSVFTLAIATSATVAGADGATRTLDFGSIPVTDLAVPVLAGISPAAALFIDAAGAASLAAGQTAAIDDVGIGTVSLAGNAAAGESIVAATGDFRFAAGTGSGTVLAGSGSNLIDLEGGGNWNVAVGSGANSIVAVTGDDTIGTGGGASLIFFGSGSGSLASGGADTIVGGAGSDTVSASGANSDLVIDQRGSLIFAAGSGASTVVAGQGAATISGGVSGGTLAFGNGSVDYIGATAADTVCGLSGSLTVTAGTGGGLFFGGTAGDNVIDAGPHGNVTALGGGAGDVLAADSGYGPVLFAAGPGAETLTGANGASDNIFLAGSGPDTLIGGGGANALVAGTGSDLLSAGNGTTLFLFAAGLTGGGNDIVAGFDPSRDFIRLLGYAAPPAAVLQQATFANGNETLTLSDGTSVTFAGVTQLGAGSFI